MYYQTVLPDKEFNVVLGPKGKIAFYCSDIASKRPIAISEVLRQLGRAFIDLSQGQFPLWQESYMLASLRDLTELVALS